MFISTFAENMEWGQERELCEIIKMQVRNSNTFCNYAFNKSDILIIQRFFLNVA